jgi:uncharacterized repeat protein (TIGR01451 family)
MEESRLEPRFMPAVITPFTVRYSANASGNILFAGNTLMTAPTTGRNARDGLNAQAGTGDSLNNNDFNMVYVDADANGFTFNSSRATMTLPAAGSVLFAGLYWGGDSNSSSRNTVLFKTPTNTDYTQITGQVIGAVSSSGWFGSSSNDYHAFADVTAAVRTAANGTYAVANVQANTGENREAGWSLVVVYGDPSAPPRNLTVFDGFAVVDSDTPNVTIPISGFQAPLSGPVETSVGFLTYEGDAGYTGDSVRFNNITLTDAANPADNFFNSTISREGVLVTSKDVNYVNQMGFDADVIRKSGLLANGATSTTIKLTTGGESYYPGVVTTAIDLHAPIVTTSKTVSDLNGGSLEPGDVLEYTSTVRVVSGDTATQFVVYDPIPTST